MEGRKEVSEGNRLREGSKKWAGLQTTNKLTCKKKFIIIVNTEMLIAEAQNLSCDFRAYITYFPWFYNLVPWFPKSVYY